MKVVCICSALAAWVAMGPAANAKDVAWTKVDAFAPSVMAGEAWIRPQRFSAVELDVEAMRAQLAQAPLEFSNHKPLRMALPTPDGTFSEFEVYESPMLPDALQAKYPEIRTYVGQGVDDPAANVRFDLVPAGFHASVLSPNGEYSIDPVSRGDAAHYASYYTRDHVKPADGPGRGWKCETPETGPRPGFGSRGMPPGRSGATLRTFRIAVTASGEFTQFHGGTVTSGLAAVVTLFNRVTQVLELEQSIRLVLVANDDLLIYTNAATDPFPDPTNFGSTNPTNHTLLINTIGAANFDLGHFLNRGADSGNAGAIGTVCNPTNKGQGSSQTEPPVGDRFAVKLICHELGHQFGAYHTFNSCFGGQAGLAGSALETGSGTTIMSYAGICSADENVAVVASTTGPDVMYHSHTYDEIQAYISGAAVVACPVGTATGNTPPSVDAGSGRSIPKATPFTLTAVALDTDGDALTYSWEERDAGPAITLVQPDNGTSPIVRVRAPQASPSRTIPEWPALLANTASRAERLPALARTMRWTVECRDNRAGGGGVATDDVTLNVVGTAGPFRITSPNTNVTIAGATTVTWDVAGTSAAPIGTQFVQIRASGDGGLTWPYLVADNVPNTGTANVLLPNINTTQARLMIRAIDNYYFDITDVNFTINFVPPGVALIPGGDATFTDGAGTANRNSALDPGETQIGLVIPLKNSGATTATGVSGTLASLTPTVTVTTATVGYPDMGYNIAGNNAQRFRIALSPTHTCGAPINLRLTFGAANGSGTSTTDITFPTGVIPGETTVNWNSRRLIPDGSTTGIQLPVTLNGLRAPITRVAARVTGTNCSAAAGLVTAGIAHNTVNQLALSLISPTGTTVRLWDRSGGAGNNLCNTGFDDAAVTPSIGLLAAAAPFSDTYQPAQPLAAFNGENPNGVWNLLVQDLVSGDTGSLLSYSLTVRGSQTPVCSAPRCPADFDDGTGTGTPDGGVTLPDLLYFLGLYDAGTAGADVDDGSGLGERDGGVTLEDLLYYLARYEIGC